MKIINNNYISTAQLGRNVRGASHFYRENEVETERGGNKKSSCYLKRADRTRVSEGQQIIFVSRKRAYAIFISIEIDSKFDPISHHF